MNSINAEQVAKGVIKSVRKGEKVNLGKIIKSVGYSEGISKQPTRITTQKIYKKKDGCLSLTVIFIK